MPDKPLQVDAIAGERLCFFVHSEANPKKVYRVSLLEHGGIGECSCPWFRTHVWPRIKAGACTLEGPCEDKHIRAARDILLRDTLKELSHRETEAHALRHR